MNPRTLTVVALLIASALRAAEPKDDPGAAIDALYSSCVGKDSEACGRLAHRFIFDDGVSHRPEVARTFLSNICATRQRSGGPCLDRAVGLACRRLGGMYAQGE